MAGRSFRSSGIGSAKQLCPGLSIGKQISFDSARMHQIRVDCQRGVCSSSRRFRFEQSISITVKKEANIVIGLLSTLLCVISSPALAQSGPSGSNYLSFVEATNLVWDLSALSNLRTAIIQAYAPQTGSEIRFDFDAEPILSSGGKVTGTGQTNIGVGYYSPGGGSGGTNFIGTYKLSASVSSSKGLAKGSYSFSIAGKGDLNGKSCKMKGSRTTTFTINNFSNLVSGTSRSSASIANVGSLHGEDPFRNLTITNSGMGDAHWELALDLTTNGKVVTGSVATATLSSGRVLNFTPKGTFTAKTQTTKLVLTGVGAAKGSSLQIGMWTTNNVSEIKTVKGKLLGQTIALSR
jgi:hypothetical protein